MPPFVSRKRASSTSNPIPETPAKRVKRGASTAKNDSVFDAVEAKTPSARDDEKQKFLRRLDASSSDSSSLSDAQTSQESHATKHYSKHGRQANSRSRSPEKGSHLNRPSTSSTGESEEDDDEGDKHEDEDEWDEFVEQHTGKTTAKGTQKTADAARGNLEITLDQAVQIRRSDIKTTNDKKGPSKIERQIRNSTHQLHVMGLMYHNYIRNHWLNNKGLQSNLLKQIPAGCRDEIKRWKHACGDALKSYGDAFKAEAEVAKDNPKSGRRRGAKAKNSHPHHNVRDWGPKSSETEQGNPNLSHGDPTLRLLKALSAFWRKRFEKTAPGLRKRGYKSMERIQDELRSFRQEEMNQDEFGERIESLKRFREFAAKSHGSRDVGAQLFTALLRAVGLKARLVSNLQPAGFGWSKNEEADPPKKQAKRDGSAQQPPDTVQPGPKKSSAGNNRKPRGKPTTSKLKANRESKPPHSSPKRETIDLSTSAESSLSSPPDSSSDSDASVKEVPYNRPSQSRKRYDGDLKYPNYWTEVLSPVTSTWIPVDPIVLSVVANNADSHSVFEPRGAGADHTKQVLAYVIAFDQDGTAKDVTTRYLKRHMWPGKTKGVRYPIEKLPIYNKAGKVARHHQYDWFEDVMSLYKSPSAKHSKADELEDARDLKPVHPTRNTNTDKQPQESLQFYKSSAEFVLERHLRREEALLPHAQPVKTFRVGKGDSAKDEPVYKRVEVVACKSAESWHKEGRQIQVGAQPLKRVPMRAVTASRKAEVEQAERETGEKMQQALFSRNQTEWIIPPPIEDGVIPKNAFGNMDVYVPTMVPKGAAHVPLRGTAKICKKLGIDFAEACTGFEFGNRMAVPVLTGVVVAEENKRMLTEAWREEERIRKEKEAKKREKIALGMWRKLLAGLRVVERVRTEYGGIDEVKLQRQVHKEMDAEAKAKGRDAAATKKNQKKGKIANSAVDLTGDDIAEPNMPRIGFPEASEDAGGSGILPNGDDVGETGGGFLPEGMDAEIIDRKPVEQSRGNDDYGSGEFVIEDGIESSDNHQNKVLERPMKSLREQAAQGDDINEEVTSMEPQTRSSQPPTDVQWQPIDTTSPIRFAVPKKRGRPSNGETLKGRFVEKDNNTATDNEMTPLPKAKKRGRPSKAQVNGINREPPSIAKQQKSSHSPEYNMSDGDHMSDVEDIDASNEDTNESASEEEFKPTAKPKTLGRKANSVHTPVKTRVVPTRATRSSARK